VAALLRTRIAFRGDGPRRAWAVALGVSVLLHAALLAWPRWPSFREVGGGEPGLAARIVSPPVTERSGSTTREARPSDPAVVSSPSEIRSPDRVAGAQRSEAATRRTSREPDRVARPEPQQESPRSEREFPPSAQTAISGASAVTTGPTPGASSDIASVAQYRIVLMSAARRFVRAPDAGAAQGAEGRVDVRLSVAADGTLARTEVARSSGNVALDELAVEILRSAKPHAPVPPALLARPFDVEVPVVFGGAPAAPR